LDLTFQILLLAVPFADLELGAADNASSVLLGAKILSRASRIDIPERDGIVLVDVTVGLGIRRAGGEAGILGTFGTLGARKY
jgi:hypothetical protein